MLCAAGVYSQYVVRNQHRRSLVRKCGMDAEVRLCITTGDTHHVRYMVVLGIRRSGHGEHG